MAVDTAPAMMYAHVGVKSSSGGHAGHQPMTAPVVVSIVVPAFGFLRYVLSMLALAPRTIAEPTSASVTRMKRTQARILVQSRGDFLRGNASVFVGEEVCLR